MNDASPRVANPNTFFQRAKTSARRLGAVSTLFLALSGCGVTYFSPNINPNDDDGVTVVPMTMPAVHAANSSPYTPRSLPQVFFAEAGAGGVVGAGAVPPAPYLPDERIETLDYRPLPDVAPMPYRIGVGDVLLLATKGRTNTVEQLSGLLAATNQRQGYTVRDDGTITIPDVGTIGMEGLTVEEAENRIFQVLVENQIDPSFSLEVSQFNSQKVAVGGAVNAPKIVPITPNRLTLGEALISAGGVATRDREFASIRIYRDGTLYQIPLQTFDENAGLKDKLLQNGDAIYVDTNYDLDRALAFYEARISVIAQRESFRATALTALSQEISIRRAALEERRSNFERREALGAVDRDYVYLAGEVNNQARFPLPFNQTATLADVLFGEGGFDTTTGNPGEIYVLRAGAHHGNSVVAYHLNARNAANFTVATLFQMRPNDVVFIEEQPITKWRRSLQQLFPALLNTAQRAL